MALVEEFLRREEKRVKPVIVEKGKAPVKEVVSTGDKVNLKELPVMRHTKFGGNESGKNWVFWWAVLSL